jgi:hypothetical protein
LKLELLVFIALSLTSTISIVRIFGDIHEPAFDFHSYWYAGHFIWQGLDPYRAALESRDIHPPVTYRDGVTITTGLIRQYDQFMPANTAPMVLLLAPLARFSWPVATLIWSIINCTLSFLLASAITKLLWHKVLSLKSVLIFFVLISLVATRDAIRFGQTTIIVLACMFISIILVKKHSFLSGVLLGIALSKYSLSFPVLFLFVYKRWYTPIGISIVVQVVGLQAIALLGHTTIGSVLTSYFSIMKFHLSMGEGTNLSNAFSSMGKLIHILVFIGSLLLIGLLIMWYVSYHHEQKTGLCYAKEVRLADISLLNIGIQWDLLALYHRRYDSVAIILFFGLVLFCVRRDSENTREGMTYHLSRLERGMIYAIVAICCVFWMIPIVCIKVLGFALCENLSVIGHIIALVLSVWLLFRVPPIRHHVQATT